MTLVPLLQAPFAVKLHVATVLPAFLLGTWLIFFSKKGAPRHWLAGFVYLTLMTITSIAALFIHTLMPHGPFLGFSPIHLFVPLTLFGVVGALYYARRHNVAAHRKSMWGVYVGGLLIAGSFTLLPGRIIHQILFSH